MSKIDKKTTILSSDIYKFSKDPFRKLINKQDENSLLISLNDGYSTEKTGNGILLNSKEEYDASKEEYSGFVILDCYNNNRDQLISAINSVLNQPISNVNIGTGKHFEPIEDLVKQKKQNIAGYLSFETNFIYNYLSKNYEKSLEDNPTLPEISQPYYYDLMAKIYSKTGLRNLIGKDIFAAPYAIMDVNNISKEYSKVIYNSNILFDDARMQYNKFLNIINAQETEIPFYSKLKIDFHEKSRNNFSNIFHENNFFNIMLDYATTTNSIESKAAVSDDGQFTSTQQIEKTIIKDDLYDSVQFYTSPEVILKLQEIKVLNNVTFKQILNGNQNYSEVIGYILNKYDTFGPKAAPIQQILFPNLGISENPRENYIHFIDTQIKYNKKYKYTVDLIVLSIDQTYHYTSASAFGAGASLLSVNYRYKPSVNFYIIKNSSQYTNKVLSAPPIKPFIEFLPYVDVNNKLKVILYNNPIQKTTEKPIPLSFEEENIVNDIKTVQNKMDNTIDFKFDDGILSKFEVYKLDKRPYSYDDFNGRLIKSIDTKELETAGFEDTIAPEKYYYYTFRGIDYHGLFSNPTEIYEIIHSNGSLNVKILDLSLDATQQELTFRKYLQISPSLAQIQQNEGTDSVYLGINKESLWDKKFKIRLTSRSTGKKIDLNLRFKYEVTEK